MSVSIPRALLHKNPDCLAEHLFLHHEIAERMLSYLAENPNFKPTQILEMGRIDDVLKACCQATYPDAAFDVLDYEAQLPLRADLVISNLFLQDAPNIETAIATMKDHLNPNGKIFMSTTGLESFANCIMPDGPEFNDYPDIKRLGDYLHSQGFIDVIVHVEKITLQYNQLDAMLKDLRVAGGRVARPLMKGLRTRAWYEAWAKHMDKAKTDDIYDIEIEILYAHAQMPPLRAASLNQDNEAHFDIKHLKHRKRFE